MANIWSIFKRELAGYFITPVAYVFIVIFLVLTGYLTFQENGFFERGQADLIPFFVGHPLLFLFLVPAVAMRLWAEERKTGTVELMMTLPITPWQAVLGKFLAAWIFTGIALALTFPLVLTVNYLGAPDNGVIFASYLGSFLMAGSYMAIGSCISALTRNQVIAFVLGAVICLVFLLCGNPTFLQFFQWAPDFLVDGVATLSFFGHYEGIVRGVLDVRDLLYFLTVIGFWLFANVVVLDWRKGK
ncbi:MAG: ABC transporter permease [Planctomycetota bacterium]|nr:MAG: ABC transporter permease [Planctomycetota bacterium]